MKDSAPVGRSGSILPLKISIPWKRDFRYSEAKSVCFNISFEVNCTYLIFLQVFDWLAVLI